MCGEGVERAAGERGAEPRAALLPCALAWLVPGGGHFYLGRRLRGLGFFAVVLVTYSFGLVLEGRAYVADPEHPLTYLATFANLGIGPLDLIQREATYQQLVWRLPRGPAGQAVLERMRSRVRSRTSEYGTMFLLTACLMNLLLILDAFDVATGRKGRAP